jgi:chemotaxis response regulator CheB
MITISFSNLLSPISNSLFVHVCQSHQGSVLTMSTAPVKVALIEDSVVALEIMERLLKSAPEVEVVGTARDGKEGLAMVARTQPDVICTDLQMPEMDGLTFTKELMKTHPRPILVVSNAVHPGDVDNIYELMQAGAMDFFPKPTTGIPSDYEKLKSTLVMKIKVLASKKR